MGFTNSLPIRQKEIRAESIEGLNIFTPKKKALNNDDSRTSFGNLSFPLKILEFL